MNQIRRIIFKIRKRLLYLWNNIVSLFLKNSKKEIYIVSSPKYKNKVKEDLQLQRYFLKNKAYCKIVSYTDNIKNKNCLIRTVWGYHKDFDTFMNFIKNNNTINPLDIITSNSDKKKQYKLLEDNNINRIPTTFLEDGSTLKKVDNKMVIKPVLSASGDNTYLIEKEEDLANIKNLHNIMIQPYIDNIKDGELSLVIINGKLQYGIMRHPGVFTKYEKETFIAKEKIDNEALNVANSILKIKEYENITYMRIDLVKDKEDYKVLELELIDPDLFIETIPDKQKRKDIYLELISSTLNKIGKE